MWSTEHSTRRGHGLCVEAHKSKPQGTTAIAATTSLLDTISEEWTTLPSGYDRLVRPASRYLTVRATRVSSQSFINAKALKKKTVPSQSCTAGLLAEGCACCEASRPPLLLAYTKKHPILRQTSAITVVVNDKNDEIAKISTMMLSTSWRNKDTTQKLASRRSRWYAWFSMIRPPSLFRFLAPYGQLFQLNF